MKTKAFTLAALLLVTSTGHAQSPGTSSAIAEALFRQARDLFKTGNYDEACPKFAESQRLEPKLGTLLNLAVCHDKQGRLASAWAEYTSAATLARREGQKDRETFARQQASQLEAKLPHLLVTAPDAPAGLAVTVDDNPLTGAMLGTPLPIDPGEHRVAATAPGKAPWGVSLKIAPEKATIPVVVPALGEANTAAGAPSALDAPKGKSKPAPVETTEPVAPPPAKPYAWLVPVGFGVAATGLLVGAVTGGMTLAKAGDIKDTCTNSICPPDQKDALSEANALSNVSNVAFAVGALGVGAGIAGIVLSSGAPASAAHPSRVQAFVGAGSVGMTGSF